MIAIKIKNKALDILPNMSLNIERTSPIWFGDDVDFVPGTVTIPFSLPLTRFNIGALNFVHHLGNRLHKKQFDGCEILVNQNLHLSGTMEIEQIGSAISAKVYSGVGGLQTLKTKKLNDATLYLSDTVFNNTVADMNDSLTEGDIIYLPFFKEDTLINNWDVDTQTFTSAVDAVAFVDAVYLLEKIIEGQGWKLIWRSKEIYRHVIYTLSNQAKTGSFTLSSILPNATSSDFIKELAIVTGHYIDVDNVKKIIKFDLYSELGKSKVIDLTDKIVNIDNQEFLSVDFVKDCTNHTHSQKIQTQIKSYPAGPITYNRRYIVFTDDINTTLEPQDNLEKIKFVCFGGMEHSEFVTPIPGGNYGDVEGLDYPFASSYSANPLFELLEKTNHGVKSRFQTWINKIENTRLLTVTANLSPLDIQKMRFNQIVCIFNANDGNYYHFLIKKIKQTITTQHEIAELELVLLQ